MIRSFSLFQHRQWLVFGLLVTSLGVAAATQLIPDISGIGTAQSTYPRLWPSFTMTYTVTTSDATTGSVIRDQTVQLDVTNEYYWQEQVIRDGLNPREVGSTREFKDRKVCYYGADKKHRYCHEPLPAGTITSVTPELRPDTVLDIQSGRTPGFRDTSARATERSAKLRERTLPCGGPTATTCRYTERIEWNAAIITDTFKGGIVVFAEKRVNDKVIHTFRADSLEVKPGINDRGRP